MTFISLDFVIFFGVVFFAYFLIPTRFKIIGLLVASYFFYAYWNVWYLSLIIFSTTVDYMAARQIAHHDNPAHKRRFLLLSIMTNLGVLFTFKYFNFFATSFADSLHSLGIAVEMGTLNVLLPVGISFYTFQSMAYTIDVYRGRAQVENSFITFSTYIAFFPQLVAGPIERAPNLLPQFQRLQSFDYDRVVSGLRLMLFGFFIKVVIANRVSVYVNAVYNNPHDYRGLPLIIATVFFGIQIYGDFAGYSAIAIGAARVLGFDLMDNFRQPYLSRSIQEFWQRWHISLSTWFRDYLYIPLGGNRVVHGQLLLNLMLVFVVSGLWHGANWTFVIWGALHGVFMVLQVSIGRWFSWKLPAILGICLTYTLVTFAWIFFRANTVSDAWYIVRHLTDFSSSGTPFYAPNDGLPSFIIASFGVIGILFLDILDARYGVLNLLARFPIMLRWAIYYGAIFAVLVSMLSTRYEADFIYFQF